MTRLVVKREELATNSFSKEVELPEGGTRICRCIFGHYLHSQGIADEELSAYGSLGELINEHVRDAADIDGSDWMVVEGDEDFFDEGPTFFDSQAFNDIVALNDTHVLSRELKETRLREMFAEHDVQLEFTGEYLNDTEHRLW